MVVPVVAVEAAAAEVGKPLTIHLIFFKPLLVEDYQILLLLV